MGTRSSRRSRGQVKKRAVRAGNEERYPVQQDSRSVFLEELSLGVRDMAVDALVSDSSVRSLHEVMDEAHRVFDSACNGVDLSPELACRRGCAYCCYNQVSLSQAEAVYLGFHMLDSFDEAAIKALDGRVDSVLDVIRGKSVEEIGMMRHELPCIFLDDGSCSIHPARPFACRGWNSVNAGDCRSSIENRDPFAPVENHSIVREIAEGIQLGLLHGTKNLGLEAGFLILPRAVKLMHRDGVAECATRWLDGDFFFAQSRGL